jgi:hypothetical protein
MGMFCSGSPLSKEAAALLCVPSLQCPSSSAITWGRYIGRMSAVICILRFRVRGIPCISMQLSKEFHVQADRAARSSTYNQTAQQGVQRTRRQRSKEFSVHSGSAARSSAYTQAVYSVYSAAMYLKQSIHGILPHSLWLNKTTLHAFKAHLTNMTQTTHRI